jgi:small subunit ribosomal protein S20
VANHAQAEKRNRQRIVRQSHHRHFRTTMRTQVKRVRQAVERRERTIAGELLQGAIPLIDRCAQKGIIPKKRASRLVSRLTRAVSSLETPAAS